MAKFPSLQSVFDATVKTIYRFPLETVSTVVGTIHAIILIGYNDDSKQFYLKTIICSFLCLLLFLSISLYFESKKEENWKRFLTSFLFGLIVVVYVFNLSDKITTIEGYQLFVLNIVLHLLVSFAGFIGIKYNQEQFWEFNKQIFLRIITSGIYSNVIYLGLALAILAITKLFEVDFYTHIYVDLFVFICGIFNTIFFLSGVPEMNNEDAPIGLSYPKGLKNFTQFALVPIISLYLVILLCYETKIILTNTLPIGWVSYLVLGFAIFGILAFLLIQPISNEKGNLWIRTFSRWFYLLLVPLLGLLFWAILYRISLYGYTYERYYVLLLSVWLSVLVFYFIFQKNPKIIFIPVSMSLIGLLSIYGPQGVDSVSKRSQIERFESYMKIINSKKITLEEKKNLSSIVDFLQKNYGAKILIPYSGNKLTELLKENTNPDSYQIMEALGLEYHNQYESEHEGTANFNYNYNQNNDSHEITLVKGYDFYFSLSNYYNIDEKKGVKIDKKDYLLKSIKKDYGFDLFINNDTIPVKIFDFIQTNPDFGNNKNSSQPIVQDIQFDKYDLRINYISVSGNKKGAKKNVEYYHIKILVKIKG